MSALFSVTSCQLLLWNIFLSVNSLVSLLPPFLFFFLHEEYLTQVDLEEERESQEMNAMQEFDKGHGKATIVPQLLEKLSRPGQMPLYYCGGLEILSLAVTDSEWSFSHNSQSTIIILL